MNKLMMNNLDIDQDSYDTGLADTITEPELEPMALSLKQLEQVLGISHNTALKLAHTPGFPSFRVGKRMMINRELLQEWMNEQCVSKRRAG